MSATIPRPEESLEIRVLGPLLAVRDGRIRPLPASRKTRGLLAYLALAAAPCRRAELCDLLWENVADPRGELRWSLSKIKAALGDVLVATADSVSIDRTRVVVDAAAFKLPVVVAPRSWSIQKAIAMWRGEPLADAYIPDCYRYHLWWLSVREELTTIHGRLLHASVEQAWSSPPDALNAARALVAQRPFDEVGHARVAQALERSGRPGEADAYRAQARLALSADLGTSPMDVMTSDPAIPAPAEAASALRRLGPSPPVLVLERFELVPGDASLESTAALAAQHIVEGLWRSRICDVLDANHCQYVSVNRPAATVRFVLRGSILKLPTGLRLTLRFLDAPSGVVLWCGNFPVNSSPPSFSSRWTDQVVAAVAAAIRRVEMSTPAVDGSCARARLFEMLTLASTLEPSANARALAAAYSMLDETADEPTALAVAAWCHAQRSVYNWAPDAGDHRKESRRLAAAATAVGLDDANCLTVIAAARTMVGDLSSAGALLDRALKLDPGSARVHSRRGWLANYRDQPDHAIHCFRTALFLSSGDRTEFNDLVGLGVAHFIRGDHERAVTRMEQGLALNPRAVWIQRNLVPAYAAAGRHAEGAAGLSALLREHQDLSVAAVESAMVFSPPVMRKISGGLAEVGLRLA
ncbi:MAG: BTAD domain-containing putative transcriptional regulator [Alsobacter sp.]